MLYLAAATFVFCVSDAVVRSGTPLVFAIWLVASFAAGSLHTALAPSRRWTGGLVGVACGAAVAALLSGLLAALIWGVNSGSGGPPVVPSTLAAGVGAFTGGVAGLAVTPASPRRAARLAPSFAIVAVCVLALIVAGALALYDRHVVLRDAPGEIAAEVEGPIAEAVFGRRISVEWFTPVVQRYATIRAIGVAERAIRVSTDASYGFYYRLPPVAPRRFRLYEVKFEIPYEACRFVEPPDKWTISSPGVLKQPLVAAGLSPALVRVLRPSPRWTSDVDNARATIAGSTYDVSFSAKRMPPMHRLTGPGTITITVRPR